MEDVEGPQPKLNMKDDKDNQDASAFAGAVQSVPAAKLSGRIALKAVWEGKLDLGNGDGSSSRIHITETSPKPENQSMRSATLNTLLTSGEKTGKSPIRRKTIEKPKYE